MKTLLLTTVALMVSCSCRTVPVRPPLSPPSHQELALKVEEVRKGAESDLKATRPGAKLELALLLFPVKVTDGDSALVVFSTDTYPAGIIYLLQDGKWETLPEGFTTEEGPLPPRRLRLAPEFDAFEKSLQGSGTAFKRQILWAVSRADEKLDAAMVLYDVEGIPVGFLAFYVQGQWHVSQDQYQ